VHSVRDLDAAGAFYARLGFTVGARNMHSWGTHNRIVQLTNSFIELLEVAEPEKIPPHAARSFSFGAFHRDYAAAHQGLSMLLLNSSDAAADARTYEAAGISGYDVFDFGREGKRPDGSVVKLAFSLVFTRDPTSPDLSLALCQHHYPENFWNPAFQTHANGATKVAGVVIVADNPSDHHVFLKAYSGVSDLHASSLGVRAETANGEIEIMEPVAFRDQFGVQVKASGQGMIMRATRFEAADLGRAEAALRDGGIGFSRHVGRLIVSPDEAFGATLIFEPAKVG
jgi:catechol 2,3-dioxygenase-like lactoylglutathione lyase family enzyme